MIVNTLTNSYDSLNDNDKLVLLVNAIYFNEPELINIVKSLYINKDSLPDKDVIISKLISDKEISSTEADDKYSEFIRSNYGSEQ